jgi:hypothetical protein
MGDFMAKPAARQLAFSIRVPGSGQETARVVS